MLKQIPNVLTALRIVLVAPIAASIVEQAYELAFWLLLFASATDGLDGLIARRWQAISRIGSIIDPLADKLLLMSSFASLCYVNALPQWLLGVVLFRDVFIVLGAGLYYRVHGPYQFTPTWIGKISTVLQLILVVVTVMIQGHIVALPVELLDWLIVLVLVAALVSCYDYFMRSLKQSWKAVF